MDDPPVRVVDKEEPEHSVSGLSEEMGEGLIDVVEETVEPVEKPAVPLSSKVGRRADRLGKKVVDTKVCIPANKGVVKTAVRQTPPSSNSVLVSRRSSTGGLGETPSVVSEKQHQAVGKKTGSSVSGLLRKSLPEARSSLSSGSSKSLNISSVGHGARTLRSPTSAGLGKSDSSKKLSMSPDTDSSTRKFGSSLIDSTGSSTSKKPVSKIATSSAHSPSVTRELKRVVKSSSPLARSPMLSGNGSFSISRDRSSSLSGQKKIATPEHSGSRFVVLPQVEIKASDDVRLDLRGRRIRTLNGNGINLSQNLEFVYLRDNLLSSLEGIEVLKRVKVLDLSFNDFKGPVFEPLENCQVLQQLYLAGNQITSLSTLPELPNLEFLSVAQNKLKSLSMSTQPRLQVLAASKNKISSLKGFPHLPVLEVSSCSLPDRMRRY